MGMHLSKGSVGSPEVDHVNGNRLDNRLVNLRVVNRQRNNINRTAQVGRSKFVGVSFLKRAGLWRAYIGKDGKRHDLGYFKEEIDAAIARDRAAVELYGSSAKLNIE